MQRGMIANAANVNATREKKNALTAHDDAIATKLTVQFAATWRDLMRDEL